MVRVALLLLLVALATACNRKSSLSESSVTVLKDSTIVREQLVIDTLVVPASEASASFNLDSILETYNGLLAKRSSGNATVTVVKEGRNIVATANCDSVMQLMISKITELEKFRQQQTQTQSVKIVEVLPPWVRKLQYGFWALVILVAGATILFIIFKIKTAIL